MYEIEYSTSFPHNEDIEIYCKDEENIKFSLYENSSWEEELKEYIYKKGTIERR